MSRMRSIIGQRMVESLQISPYAHTVYRVDMTRIGVMKHLRVLERAGLIVVTKDGRKRWNSLNATPLQEIFRRWVGKYESVWADALLDLRDEAEKPREDKN